MLGTLLYKLNPAACLRPDIEEATIDGVASDGNKQSVGTAPTSSFTTERSGSSASSAALSCILPSSRYTPDDGGGGPPSPQALDSVLPGIFEGISAVCPGGGDAKTKKSRRKRRTEALSRLHDLTKKPDNRVALCSSGAGRDVVGVLSDALLDSVDPDSVPSEGPGGIDEDRRLICWTINNLTVPYKNKSSIVSSGNFAGLLRGLTAVVSSNLPESYLCCIALLNLTFAAEAVEPVAYFVPPPSDEGRRIRRHPSTAQQLWRDGARTSEMSARVLGNPESLMRVVERMMITNAPFLLSTVKSVQGEAFRWAAGFVRNVTSVDDPLADGGGGRRAASRTRRWRRSAPSSRGPSCLASPSGASGTARGRRRGGRRTRRRTSASGLYATSHGSSRPRTRSRGPARRGRWRGSSRSRASTATVRGP